MANRSSASSTSSESSTSTAASGAEPIDMQKLINGAIDLELKVLGAGVEYAQVWINQAAKLSSIAGDTVRAMQDDRASLSGTARELTRFGQQNAEAFNEVTTRLSRRYFDELGRLVERLGAKADDVLEAAEKPAAADEVAKKPRTAGVSAARAAATPAKPVTR